MLDLPLQASRQRTQARDGDNADRIGGRDDAFHQRVRDAFHQIAQAEPERIRLVDASGTSDEVAARIFADLLP